MRFGSCLFSAAFLAGMAVLALPLCASAQETGSSVSAIESAQLPDAPRPQVEIASAAPDPQQAPSPAPAQQPATLDSSSSQSSAQQPAPEKSQREKAEEQIKEQEKQRVVGVVPSFNVSYRPDAVSMTPGQKMRLAFRSATDPVTFAAGFVAAGYHEAMDDDKGFGWGIEGYGKRSGAAYLDAFNGTIIGNGILPSIFHQDPRYFRLGHGSFTHRLFYSLATNVVCKHDNTGKWEPNYSNVTGNIISGAISNLYYPSDGSGVSQTFTNGFIVTAEGGIGSVFQEFWPDVSRKFLHRDPTHGLDAEARAADKARKNAAKDAAANQN
jgi:hypothetical protein